MTERQNDKKTEKRNDSMTERKNEKKQEYNTQKDRKGMDIKRIKRGKKKDTQKHLKIAERGKRTKICDIKFEYKNPKNLRFSTAKQCFIWSDAISHSRRE